MNPLNQPHHPPTFCDRHPEEHIIGFCHLCLSDRLTMLDQNSSNFSSSRPSISSIANAAFKAILPKIRRVKSFSALKYEGFSCRSQRKSFDVIITGRSTLLSLFNQDQEWKVPTKELASSSVVQEAYNIDEITVTESPKPEPEPAQEPPNVADSVPKMIEEEGEMEPQSETEVKEATKVGKHQKGMDSQEKKSFGRDWKGSFRSLASTFTKKTKKHA